MRLSIVTPKGVAYDDEVSYVIVNGENGQYGILNKHVPVVSSISEGFIKIVTDKNEKFFAVSGGLLEYNSSVITLIAQEIAEGNTLEVANETLKNQRALLKESNRRSTFDFSVMEKELAQNLKQIQASKL